MTILGAMFGGLFASYPNDHLGRRRSLLLNNTFFIVGGILTALTNKGALLAGRLLLGLGTGACVACVVTVDCCIGVRWHSLGAGRSKASSPDGRDRSINPTHCQLKPPKPKTGVESMVAPVLLSEIASNKTRGAITSLHQLNVSPPRRRSLWGFDFRFSNLTYPPPPRHRSRWASSSRT